MHFWNFINPQLVESIHTEFAAVESVLRATDNKCYHRYTVILLRKLRKG